MTDASDQDDTQGLRAVIRKYELELAKVDSAHVQLHFQELYSETSEELEKLKKKRLKLLERAVAAEKESSMLRELSKKDEKRLRGSAKKELSYLRKWEGAVKKVFSAIKTRPIKEKNAVCKDPEGALEHLLEGGSLDSFLKEVIKPSPSKEKPTHDRGHLPGNDKNKKKSGREKIREGMARSREARDEKKKDKRPGFGEVPMSESSSDTVGPQESDDEDSWGGSGSRSDIGSDSGSDSGSDLLPPPPSDRSSRGSDEIMGRRGLVNYSLSEDEAPSRSPRRVPVHKSNRRDASPPRLNHDLHAIDATSARQRGGVVYYCSFWPARVAFSLRKDFVKNYRAPDSLVDFHTGWGRPRRRRSRRRTTPRLSRRSATLGRQKLGRWTLTPRRRRAARPLRSRATSRVLGPWPL